MDGSPAGATNAHHAIQHSRTELAHWWAIFVLLGAAPSS